MYKRQVYSRETLEAIASIAREYNLIVFADEIYDKILYDGQQHIPMAMIATDLLVVTFGGLSKNYRLAGFRSGWMILSGEAIDTASNYIEGLDMLANMRLCANVPGQLAVQTALGGYQSINDLVKPTGRLGAQRDLVVERINAIPGLSCYKPAGAIYVFVKMDERFNISDDEQMVLDLLQQENILVVQGSGFHLQTSNYFRLVFLPHRDVLEDACDRIERFFSTYRQL